MQIERTRYSDKIPGERGNFNQSVRFDRSRGFIGITQFDDGGVRDRVLLSPKQVEKLRRFLSRKP